MGTEIERKFLVRDALLRPLLGDGVSLAQGYLAENPGLAVRVRIAGQQAMLTVKGSGEPSATGGLVVRPEFEYAIPLADARAMLKLVTGPIIEKIRYRIPQGRFVWEVDVFAGQNSGLIVAEVELESVTDTLELPAWVAEDVSGDPRYLNVNLVKHPFCNW